MVKTLSGIVTLSSCPHPLKAFSGIAVAPLSMTAVCNPLLLNALPEDVP